MKSLDKEKKNQIANDFENLYQTIEKRRDSAEKLPRITEILTIFTLNWDDSILQGIQIINIKF